MGYYPIFLEIKDIHCVVVGGGKVAGRKVSGLLEAGAQVTVISPEVTDKLRTLIDNKRVRYLKKYFGRGDLRGAGLVIAASSDRAVNELVLLEARAADMPVNVVDDPGGSVFIVPSSIRRGELYIAISTAGRCPALARWTRLEIERAIGPEYGPFLEIMGALRERLLKKGIKGGKKDKVINRLLDSELLGLIRAGAVEEVDMVLCDIAGESLTGLGLNLHKTIISFREGDGC